MIRFTKIVFELQNRLIKNNLPIAHLNLIAEYVLNQSMNDLLVGDYDVSQKDLDDMLKIIKIFETQNIPIAQQVGFEYFYDYKFKVSEHCLIPRVETEELVYNSIEFCRKNFKKGSKLKVYDCCCGSGAIGISFYLELKDEYQIELILSDLSNDALEVCRKNLDNYGINASIYCNAGVKKNISDVDIFLANPPYIPINDQVETLVKDHEPHLALFGGLDGLDVYYDILDDIAAILSEEYFIGFEHGEGHYDKLKAICTFKLPNSQCIINYDMFSRERNTFIYNFGQM